MPKEKKTQQPKKEQASKRPAPGKRDVGKSIRESTSISNTHKPPRPKPDKK